jgi:hypothetical protein
MKQRLLMVQEDFSVSALRQGGRSPFASFFAKGEFSPFPSTKPNLEQNLLLN